LSDDIADFRLPIADLAFGLWSSNRVIDQIGNWQSKIGNPGAHNIRVI